MLKAGFISIIGRPNAGKSTLMNAMLGSELSIVTPKAQTTRDQVLGIHTEARGQVVFTDTPGIHRAREGGINQYMVHEAKQALESAHLVWYLVDPSSALKHETAVIDLLEKSHAPVLILLNKMDWATKNIPAEILENLATSITEELKLRNIPCLGLRKISALARQGLDELLEESFAKLPEGPAYYPDPDQMSDRPTRFFVAEKIRESLYYLLGEELPYCCAVEIEDFNENSKPIRIEAAIHVERDSQKGMVIGKGGHKIKEIGQSARAEIEKFLGEQIFLGLKVKVLKDWSQNAEALKKMGYLLPKTKKNSGEKAK